MDFEAGCNSLCFVMKAHFPSFHSAVITVEFQRTRNKIIVFVCICQDVTKTPTVSTFIELYSLMFLFFYYLFFDSGTM